MIYSSIQSFIKISRQFLEFSTKIKWVNIDIWENDTDKARNESFNYSIMFVTWIYKKVNKQPSTSFRIKSPLDTKMPCTCYELATQRFRFSNHTYNQTRNQGQHRCLQDGQLFAQNLVRITSCASRTFEIRVTTVLSRSSLPASLIRSEEHPGTRSTM